MEVREVKKEVEGLWDGEVLKQHVSSVPNSGNLEVDLLEDLDSYLEDINDRLTISRMVSDSVIRGMVEAVEKMAEQKIAAKELEIARMREKMCFGEVCDQESEGIAKVSNLRDELDSLLMSSLEETAHFRQLGDKMSERINEITNVRNELDLLLKSLLCSEMGLISHGSNDMDRWNSKLLSSHVSTLSSFWAENDDSEESKKGMPDSWDVAQLGHLEPEGLVLHFNTIISNMRRDHDCQVRKMTEDYFSLKREYFKEKDLSHQKEKDLEIVRKKIPEVILKLDSIVVENKKLLTFSNDATFTSLEDKFDNLLSENHLLRESLSNKKKEIESLNIQVSLVEDNLRKLTSDHESAAEDAVIKMFLIEEVYECVLRESAVHENSNNGEFATLSVRAAQDGKATNNCDIEDSDIELISQGICEVIFREAIMDAKLIMNDMATEHLRECDNRISLQLKALETGEELKLLTEENERLKQEVDLAVAMLKEKEKSGLELSTELTKERDQLKLASRQISSLESRVGWLQSSLDKKNEELDLVKGKLAEALDQVELLKLDMNKMKQEFELMSKKLRVANEEQNTIALKRLNDMAMLKAENNELRRLMQSVIGHIQGLSRESSEFESRVVEDVKKKSLRLEQNSSLLQSLFKKTNVLRRTISVYKLKLERKCADLQTAETEVDLLGDQVDTLLNLLEKVYIALDHYSSILQHYPGVMETLNLIRRELSRESLKGK